MENQITLVLGGARSGKSEFAEKLLIRSDKKNKGYIATCRVLDEEMEYRVRIHRDRRPRDWKTFEILEDGGDMMNGILQQADAFLFDCLTMYVSNLLMAHMEKRNTETLGVADLEMLQRVLQDDLDRMFRALSGVSGREMIFVSDELGMGIVPANAMSRVYRDLVGLANQYVAARAEKVYFSVAGITTELKGREVHL
jgi:adenosylcobinamide kinase/adenosylcobinamide-phosphate guanylyltransferase